MDYVCGFLFNEDKTKVLLIEKNRPDWQKGLLNGIGGKINKDEFPEQAMIREFEEETGLFIDNWHRFAKIYNKEKTWCVYFYYAINKSMMNYKSITDEIVSHYNINDVQYLITISNIKMLIELALWNINNSNDILGC